jgi:SAM-dependent methyltransferase
MAQAMATYSARLGAIEIAEGFYVSHIVYHFHRQGILERLREPASATCIAAEQGYDAYRLQALLDYVSQRTDVLLRAGPGSYALNPDYAPYQRLAFHLDKFIGAYGPLLDNLDECLRPSAPGTRRVDEQALARAFGAVGNAGVITETEIIRSWNVHSLLDLGCGPGALLVELASRDPDFHGFGVDRSTDMCRLAAERVRQTGLGDAIRILHAEVEDVGAYADLANSRPLDALHCKSLLNEFFEKSSERAVRLLESLRLSFGGRLLFVADYYGRLTWDEPVDDAYAHTLVHDVAQLLSGQGVPPPSLAGWHELYARAGTSLLHAYEGDADGIAWFIHVIRL